MAPFFLRVYTHHTHSKKHTDNSLINTHTWFWTITNVFQPYSIICNVVHKSNEKWYICHILLLKYCLRTVLSFSLSSDYPLWEMERGETEKIKVECPKFRWFCFCLVQVWLLTITLHVFIKMPFSTKISVFIRSVTHTHTHTHTPLPLLRHLHTYLYR